MQINLKRNRNNHLKKRKKIKVKVKKLENDMYINGKCLRFSFLFKLFTFLLKII